MNAKIANIINTTKGFVKKHSPEILTGIGVTGMITSTVLAVKATPKAINLINDKKFELNYELSEKLPVKEVIKAAWKPYIPAVVTGVMSATCIIGASAVNTKRNAALATAYAISEKTLLTYRDKVIETIGEKKEKEIRNKISQDKVNKEPASKTQVFITPKGNTLCMDDITGRYFRSDIEAIKKAVNELNKRMMVQNYVSLNELYSAIGLEPISTGNRIGWNIDKGFIDVDFNTCLADNDEPCIVVEYSESPYYEFDRLS